MVPVPGNAPRLARERMPRHVAVVMDGNGRWASRRGLPRAEGHVVGARRVLDLVDSALEIGLQELSVFGFSTENWRRSADEVAAVLAVIAGVMRDQASAWHRNGVRVRWVGRPVDGWPDLARHLTATQQLTATNTVLRFNVCVNYGGRAEIIDAAQRLACAAAAGSLDPAEIDEQRFQGSLYSPDMRPVDLLIRSSGERRTSNFLLWQAAYAELVFTQTLWPDFGPRDLRQAIATFAERDRRLGGAPDSTTTARAR